MVKKAKKCQKTRFFVINVCFESRFGQLIGIQQFLSSKLNEIQYLRPKLTSLKYFRTYYMVKKAKNTRNSKNVCLLQRGISSDQNIYFYIFLNSLYCCTNAS